MTRNKIENLVKKLAPRGTKFSITYPPKEEYGDYSVFFPLKKAQILKKKIANEKPNFLEKVEVLPPAPLDSKHLTGYSFLNFYLKKEFLQKQVGEILKKGEDFGKLNLGRGKKINIEFISANPTGPLHIGNGRAAFFGDALANILEKAGFKITREYYINDAKVNTQIQELGKTALGKGKSYFTPYLESLIAKLKPHLKALKNESDAGYFLSQNIYSDIRKFISKKLKIKFDRWTSEQILYREDKIYKTFKYLNKKNLVYKKEDAWWLKTSKFGDTKDEVLIRKNGQPTYFLSDIAYHQDKIKRGYKKIIDIWGADHQGHIKRMEAAMEMLNYKGGFKILISQIVRLKSGKKLSKRKGEVVELGELINEVGLDIARYFYLSKSLSSQMEFDLELAKEQSEKNPVYYIQYAYVRIQSILKKVESRKWKVEKNSTTFYLPPFTLKLLNHPSELNLIRELIKFPEIIENTVGDYQLQRLPEYGRNLATAFHQFYRDCKVLISENSKQRTENRKKSKKLMEARVALILATKIVLKNTLNLMGISTPEKM
jgi:arginyl-tRNA synthetase